MNTEEAGDRKAMWSSVSYTQGTETNPISQVILHLGRWLIGCTVQISSLQQSFPPFYFHHGL